MRFLRILATLGLLAVTAAACEDITNPVEEEGALVGPYVRLASSSASVKAGSVGRVIFQLPTPVEESVSVTYTLGGSAVLGQDFVPVDRNGAPRADVTASGGTATLPYRLESTNIAADTLLLSIPATATAGRTVEVQIASATTESGVELATGYVDQFKNFVLTITQ